MILGMHDTPERLAWRSMRNRCYSPESEHFNRYGGRGITVCDKWKNDFDSFFYDVGPRPSNQYSIHRINNNGNYEPGNVEWATKEVQCNSRASSRVLEYVGQRKTLSQWSRDTGLGISTIHFRLKSGWTVPEALTTPLRRRAIMI